MLTTLQISWLAGILEGEGYFGIQSSPRITVGMTDKDVIDKIAALVKKSHIIYVKGIGTLKDKYVINLFGVNAVEWMMTLYPLMGERRQKKIEVILSRWKQRLAWSEAHKKLSINQRQEILELYETKSMDEIARYFGIDRKTVSKYIKELKSVNRL